MSNSSLISSASNNAIITSLNFDGSNTAIQIYNSTISIVNNTFVNHEMAIIDNEIQISPLVEVAYNFIGNFTSLIYMLLSLFCFSFLFVNGDPLLYKIN